MNKFSGNKFYLNFNLDRVRHYGTQVHTTLFFIKTLLDLYKNWRSFGSPKKQRVTYFNMNTVCFGTTEKETFVRIGNFFLRFLCGVSQITVKFWDVGFFTCLWLHRCFSLWCLIVNILKSVSLRTVIYCYIDRLYYTQPLRLCW